MGTSRRLEVKWLVSARVLTVFVIAHNDSQELLATIDRIYSALAVDDYKQSLMLAIGDDISGTLGSAKVDGAGNNVGGRPLS